MMNTMFRGAYFLFLTFTVFYTRSYCLFKLLQAVQKLVDEEFQGIVHLRTSTFQKKVASARHDFIKVAGSENKLEALIQVISL